MRWNTAKPPVQGDMRERHGFLYFPKTIGAETRWFEQTSWVEEFRTEHCPDWHDDKYWEPTKWSDQ